MKKMKIAIVGFSVEGRATYDYFSRLSSDRQNPKMGVKPYRNLKDPTGDYEITVCDQRTDLIVPDGANAVLGDNYLDNLDRFDLIVRTAGMHPRTILEKNPGVAGKITTHINEFIKASPTRNIIGVTGTKGKGTTSTLIAKMLEADGKVVRLGGNIGVPPLSFIHELRPDSWVVLELSSYQLIDFGQTSYQGSYQGPHIAVCLMIAPEHLDWHTDLEEYITAKEQLFVHQGAADVVIYYHGSETSKRIASAGQGQKVPYCHAPGAEVIGGKSGGNIGEDGESGAKTTGTAGSIVIDGHEICRTDELQLIGRHNWQNVCAAITAVWYACVGPQPQVSTIPALLSHPSQPERAHQVRHIQAMRSVLTTFTGLPFRLEYRGEIGEIKYYNDSFASAPPAPVAALEAIPEKQVLIIGGYDRHLELEELVTGLQKNRDKLRHVLVIGATSQQIIEALQTYGFTGEYTLSGTSAIPVTPASLSYMRTIVREATALAEPGDAVVLSPGFASFDRFKNFEDRGRQFNTVVEELEQNRTDTSADTSVVMKAEHQNPYTFVFDSYRVEDTRAEGSKKSELVFAYYYKSEQGQIIGRFEERYVMPVTIDSTDALTQYILQQLHIIVGVSYYKSLLGKVAVPYSLTQAEADYYNTIYNEGFGEYSFVNKLTESIRPFSASAMTGSPPSDKEERRPIPLQNHGALLGIGGGKDSIVAAEIAKGIGLETTVLDITTRDHHGQAGAIMKETGLPQLSVNRYVDRSISTFTNQHGGMRGHIPIGAIFAWIGILLAYVTGKRYIMMANEAAASSGNVEWNGRVINHQWTKSLQAEKLTQAFVHAHVSPDLWYFSPIRAYGSLAVMELFALLGKAYYQDFTSCNLVLRIDPAERPNGRWCTQCAKCLSTWLLLSAKLDTPALERIFGRNLFKDTSLRPTLEALLGLSGHKPLDCVGTIEELRAVARQLLEKDWGEKNGGHEEGHPLLSGITAADIPGPDIQTLIHTQSEDSLPPELAEDIGRYVDELLL